MSQKKVFVLVHGSWHSAWNWYRVKPILERMSHEVIAPDLPGMGKDKTPLENIRFNTTVQGLCDLITGVPGKVVLCGHSKNGILISQVAEHIPDKIDKLVYLAAVLAEDGKCALDYFKLDKAEILSPHISYDDASNSSMLLPSIYRKGLYHDCDEEIVELAKVILSPEPRQTATYPLKITDQNFGRVPRYYIECTEDRAISLHLQQEMYRALPCERVYKIQASHSPFFSKPEELANLLVEISNQ